MGFRIKNRNYISIINEVLSRQHFMNHIGFVLSEIGPGMAEGKLDFKEFLKQQNGFLHGGVIATLCDLACGLAAHTLVSENEFVVTSDLKISYLNPGTGASFLAKGWVIKQGNLLIFSEAEINDATSGLLIAKASATLVVVTKTN